MPILQHLARALKQGLKSETRNEFEERYLAQAKGPGDFEARVRYLLSLRNPRMRTPRMA